MLNLNGRHGNTRYIGADWNSDSWTVNKACGWTAEFSVKKMTENQQVAVTTVLMLIWLVGIIIFVAH